MRHRWLALPCYDNDFVMRPLAQLPEKLEKRIGFFKKRQGAFMPDPELKGQTERTLRPPTQCVLWREPERIASPDADRFELLEDLVESSHWDRALLRCRECGQLYFFEFYETIDWEGGDDAQYTTYIPVQTREEVEALKQASVFDLLLFSPRLRSERPTDAKAATILWIGK